MDALTAEWLNLIVRWVHVIAGIAWIGSSFFFNWLDSRLEPPANPRGRVEGELWMVHSGGFYRMQKLQLAPEELPATLHWVKWEAGFTWISGFLLLLIVYYLGGGAFLVDRSVADIGGGTAMAIGLGSLALGWVVYDLLWRSPLAQVRGLAAALSFALLAAAGFGLHQFLSPNAAYLHAGAVMGTIMAANVWMVIIPAQRQMVAATKAGVLPDAKLAANAKRRSLHNNYMTLPVVFTMVSGHYPSTWGHEWNWLILAGLFLVGAGVRHFFNLRNRGRAQGWILIAAAAGMAALYFLARS